MSVAIYTDIKVMRHAISRATERFPELGLDMKMIRREVRDALKAGRISPYKPPGITGPPDPLSLYLWTEDGARVYAVHHGSRAFHVMTTMRPGLAV